MSAFIEKWESYRDSRQGTYEYRCRTRYKAVADKLFVMGLRNCHSVRDVGAGTCQFGRYLRERGWTGDYLPVDAVLDGTDLATCRIHPADFIVCIETIEHLHNPFEMIGKIMRAARRGCVLTTPNPDTVDVLGCDPTHISFVSAWDFQLMGLRTNEHSWFGGENDTLLAHWERRRLTC